MNVYLSQYFPVRRICCTSISSSLTANSEKALVPLSTVLRSIRHHQLVCRLRLCLLMLCGSAPRTERPTSREQANPAEKYFFFLRGKNK